MVAIDCTWTYYCFCREFRLNYYIASNDELDHEIRKGEARLQELRSMRNYPVAKRFQDSNPAS